MPDFSMTPLSPLIAAYAIAISPLLFATPLPPPPAFRHFRCRYAAIIIAHAYMLMTPAERNAMPRFRYLRRHFIFTPYHFDAAA
jgi:hypothetical protein